MRTESKEMYLKTIYLLSKKKGEVRNIDIASELLVVGDHETIGAPALERTDDRADPRLTREDFELSLL